MIEIILLAMVAGFLALRLYSVLGKRTGHEQPIAKPVDQPVVSAPVVRRNTDAPPVAVSAPEATVAPSATDGIRAISAAEPGFDVGQFLGGAQAAYRMVLEAFWRGDVEELDRLADGEVRDAFAHSIAERTAAGHVVANRMIGIERAVIEQARLEGRTASIAVRFDADISAMTRDAEGVMIAGSLSDAVETHDLWTFSRQVKSDDPNWILVETDEAA